MIITTRRLLASLLVFLFTLSLPLAAQQNPLAPSSEPAETTVSAETEALINALEDPDARARLIEALRNPNTAAALPDAAEADPEESRTVATRAAEISQQLISEVGEGASRVVSDLGRFALLPELLTPERRAAITAGLLPLLITILVTVGFYRLGRFFSARVRLNALMQSGAMLARTGVFITQVVLRIIAVLLAWVAGYTVASFVLGDGRPDLTQAIYLNAFLIFGLLTTALSVFVSDDDRDMTFADLPRRTEATVYRSMRRVFGFLIYGLVAVAPISQVWVNFVLARSMRTAVVTLGVLAAIYAIFRIRRALEAEAAPSDSEEDTADTARANLWQAAWPWLGVLYVLISYGVALANPNQMVELVGRATVMTAVGVGVFLISMRCFKAATQKPVVTMPPTIDALLPPLGDRITGFLPLSLMAAGTGLAIVAGALVLEGWHLIDLAGWLANGGNDMIVRVISLIIGVAVLVVAWCVLTAWIDTRLSEELSGKQVSSRSRTLLALFKNVVSIALVLFGGMTVLSELGVDIAPLLAGAGVLGLAIGFGAQKLVQDIITGIFIQLENAINEGDVVTVAGTSGTVEKLTIRSVGLRDVAGTYHLIPFSSVDTVSNFMRRFAYHVEVAGIAYNSDMDAAKQAMHDAFDIVKAGELGSDIIAPLEWHGVIAMGESAVNLRARIKTRAGKQWAIGRAYTEQVKRALDAAGIEIPFPHRELKLPKELIDRIAPAAASPALPKPVAPGEPDDAPAPATGT
ncbi:MAG: mechanosensitive ion channel domain-containing protein, partial [Pseudomonadota bacterium]